MTVWLERLRPSDLHLMLPQVLLTLDQIRDQAMGPERRLAMLRALRDQVEAIQGVSRPKPLPPDRGLTPARTPSLTLEQRHAGAWCGNLQRLLLELGQPRYAGHARFAVYREWTLRQLLRGLINAVEWTVRLGQPAQCGLWRAVYDLFLYLEGRDELEAAGEFGGDPGRFRFNPATELKHLFLLGGIGAYGEGDRLLRELGGRLRDWAEGAELRRGESPLSEARILRLDVARDEPPQWGGQAVSRAYNGWLLDLPPSLNQYLESLESGMHHQTEGV